MKKICIICEGCYPYVTGGVSSWVHDLIKLNPQDEFSIVALVPNEEFIDYKYKLHSNVSEVKNIVLNQILPLKENEVKRNKRSNNSDIEKKIIKRTLNFNQVTSREIIECIEYFSKDENKKQNEIALKESFWEAISEFYNERGFETGLNHYYWTYRNLFLNLISLGTVELPKADIYHSVSTGYAGILTAIAYHRGLGKTLITEHGLYSREREEDIIGSKWIEKEFKGEWIDFFKSICKVGYEYCDQIVTLFDYNREYEVLSGAPAEKCLVVPNGIDTDMYKNIQKYTKDKFSIGSVLRIVPIKDVFMMINGIAILKEKIQDFHLYLIGPTDEEPDYYMDCIQLVSDLDLEEYITFTGKTDVKEYYKFLDLFLLTSISEGQPLSILEAMASGIPSIATDVGNCRDILTLKKDIGSGGIIIPPTDYEALANEIYKLYNNREILREFGENSKKIVNKYYRKEDFDMSYKKIYNSLINKK